MSGLFFLLSSCNLPYPQDKPASDLDESFLLQHCTKKGSITAPLKLSDEQRHEITQQIEAIASSLRNPAFTTRFIKEQDQQEVIVFDCGSRSVPACHTKYGPPQTIECGL